MAWSYGSGFAAAHMKEPFVGHHPKATIPIVGHVLHAGNAGELIELPLAKAVKPAGTILLSPTDPQRALPVLIDAAHVAMLQPENG